MPAPRDRSHIVIPGPPSSEPFTSPSGGGDAEKPPFTGDRGAHARKLTQELQAALADDADASEVAGTYITFQSFPGLELALESLGPQRSGAQPELIAVKQLEVNGEIQQQATVYIPDGQKNYFLTRLQKYAETATQDKPSNAKLVEGIQEIRRATVRELWTDPPDLFPEDPSQRVWWEVWLRRRDGHEQERLQAFARRQDLRTGQHYLGFADRTVVLLQASADQLAQALNVLDDLAELRRPHEVASLLTELPASDQAEWVQELQDRLTAAAPDAPVVCVLDTGVQNTHPLLTDSLHPADLHAVDATWNIAPIHGHGTEMAGLALFGDLAQAVQSALPVNLAHRLESVKLLPDTGGNDPDLYGALTARAVDRPEIQAGQRQRVFMLAVTAPRPTSPRDTAGIRVSEDGKPTSWSASIDALAYGRAIDDSDAAFTYLDRDEPPHPRLIVVSAGNIRDLNAGDDHLERSDLEPVEDPAHAWNALTVGAYSGRDDMSSAIADFAGWTPVAARGELAPTSRTSVTFDRKKWPSKPDVVADGGNVAVSPDKTIVDTPENLAILTTRLSGSGRGFFTTTRDTSAATAHVAAIAADIQAAYPHLRPETVRGLIVHSAEWTDAMRRRFNPKANKTELASLLRRYGMGVPNLERALHSANDALTLIAEATIQPYTPEGTVCEMMLHQLPWPTTELDALADAEVRMQVTLSHFIEPNPSRRGWTGRYVYPSHMLRFAVRRPEENVEAFRRRINKKARDGAPIAKLDTESGWLFGSKQQQSAGSLHTDIWTGTAAQLAAKGAIAVYPVGGWWKGRPKLDQSKQGVHYSLLVSIEAPDVDVDLWTPVANQIQTTVQVTA